VLPSLGENDVVLAPIGSLFPGVDARGPESPRAARVKGDAKMAGVLRRRSPTCARRRADLYVALTRTTRRLGLVGPGEMPRDLKAMLDRS
jgi:hypothetical protein